MTPERNDRGMEGETDWINFEDITRLAIESTLREGSHIPFMIIDGSKRLIYGGVPNIPDTHDKRMQFMYAAGQFTAMSKQAGKVRQVFFISEGWMSLPKDGELPKTLPSEDPSRKEVLIISGLEIQKQIKYLKLFEMLRDKEENLIGLTEVALGKEESASFTVPLLDAFKQGFEAAGKERAGRWN